MKKNSRKGAAKAPKIVAVVTLVALAVALVIGIIIDNGSAKAKGSKYPDWYFYDQYVQKYQPTNPILTESRNVVDDGSTPEFFLGVDSRIADAFQAAKTTLREKFGNIETLNWERFNAATIVEGKDYMVNQCDAAWWPARNTLFVWQFLKTKTDKEMEAVIAHELIHSLTHVDGECGSALYEGLTEYMSLLLYGEKDYIAYELPVRFVQLYAEAYGLEKAIAVFPYDSCVETIGALIPERKDAMGNIEGLLRSTSRVADRGAYTVIFDVMCHLCKNLNGDKELVEGIAERYLGKTNPETTAYYSVVLGN